MSGGDRKPTLGRDPFAAIGEADRKPTPASTPGPKRETPAPGNRKKASARAAPSPKKGSASKRGAGSAAAPGAKPKETRSARRASKSAAAGAKAPPAAASRGRRPKPKRKSVPCAVEVPASPPAIDHVEPDRPAWAPAPQVANADRFDEFGLDPEVEARWQKVFEFLYRNYWRVTSTGIDRLPAQGAAILVANHAGALPYDAAMLKCAVRKEHPSERTLRPLVPDFVFHLPFIGLFINRLGGVRACQENAERLLDRGELVAVFPEGVKGLGKLYRERYRLQRFGRGGFVKLALRSGVPLYPVAIVGGEEVHPMLGQVTWVASKLGIPYVPITPTFPWLGPLGAVPLPSKWSIQVGEPVDLEGAGPEDAEDGMLVGRLAEKVRSAIQGMLKDQLEERKTVFLG